MTEIITIHVGSCGVMTAWDLWPDMMSQRNIDGSGIYRGQKKETDMHKSDVFFHMDSRNQFIPRAILADLEPVHMEEVKLFNRANIIEGTGGNLNNCAKSYKSDGIEILPDILESVRKESEKCNSLQGFQMVHSIGEGTGSGLGSMMLETLRDEYPDRVLSTFTLFPSSKISKDGYLWCNSIFALSALMEEAYYVISLDSDVMVDKMKEVRPSDFVCEEDLRDPMKRIIAGSTADFHLPCSNASSQRKMSLINVPFPTMHFLNANVYPYVSTDPKDSSYDSFISQIFDDKMASQVRERYFSAETKFFGHFDVPAVTRAIAVSKNPLSKVSANTFVQVPLRGSGLSACSVNNSSSITSVFFRLMKEFKSSVKKKSFLQWYTAEGVEEVEFLEASRKLDELSKLYNYKKTSAEFDLPLLAQAKTNVSKFKDFHVKKEQN